MHSIEYRYIVLFDESINTLIVTIHCIHYVLSATVSNIIAY